MHMDISYIFIYAYGYSICICIFHMHMAYAYAVSYAVYMPAYAVCLPEDIMFQTGLSM